MFDHTARNTEIRRRYMDGESMARIGKDYDLTRQRVKQICMGLVRETPRPRVHAIDVTTACETCGRRIESRQWLVRKPRKYCGRACSSRGLVSERLDRAVLMRRQGYGWRYIAEQLGYKNQVSALNAVKMRLAKTGEWPLKSPGLA